MNSGTTGQLGSLIAQAATLGSLPLQDGTPRAVKEPPSNQPGFLNEALSQQMQFHNVWNKYTEFICISNSLLISDSFVCVSESCCLLAKLIRFVPCPFWLWGLSCNTLNAVWTQHSTKDVLTELLFFSVTFDFEFWQSYIRFQILPFVPFMPLQLVVPYYCWLQTVVVNKFFTILFSSHRLQVRVLSFLHSFVCTISLHSSSPLVVRYQHPSEYTSDTSPCLSWGTMATTLMAPTKMITPYNVPSPTSWCSAAITFIFWFAVSTVDAFFQYHDYTFNCIFNRCIRHLSSSTTSCSQSGHSWCDCRRTFILYNSAFHSYEFCTDNTWSHRHHDWWLTLDLTK